MKQKILSITEKLPQPAILPDGNYLGVQGGYEIKVEFNNRVFLLTTEDGIRGSGFKVLVTVENGVATYEDIAN